MSESEWQYVIIAWPPDTPENIFPKGWQLYPLSQWHVPIQEEQCPQCRFTVKWIIKEEYFEILEEFIREEIRYRLQMQMKKGQCPSHPRPLFL